MCRNSVHLRLIGPLVLERDGAAVAWPSGRVRETAAFLALASAHQCARSALLDAVWPDLEAKVARRRLSETLSRLRGVLGSPEWVEADADRVRLVTGELSINLDRLRGHLRTAATAGDHGSRERALEAALALLTGELLAGMDAPWIVSPRAAMEEDRAAVLEALRDRYRQVGRHADATRLARELTRLRPLDEAAHRALLQTLVLADRSTEALAAHATFRDTLRTALDVAPEASTVVLVQRIRRARSAPVATRRLERLPLVGREAEQEVLSRALDAATEGGPAVVFVRGPGGQGKSRLLAEVAELARTGGDFAAMRALGERWLARGTDPALQALARRVLAHSHLGMGSWQAMIDVLEDQAAPRESWPPEHRLQWAGAKLRRLDLVAAETEVRAVLQAADDGVVRVRARRILGAVLIELERDAEAGAAFRAAIDEAARCGLRGEQLRNAHHLAVMRFRDVGTHRGQPLHPGAAGECVGRPGSPGPTCTLPGGSATGEREQQQPQVSHHSSISWALGARRSGCGAR
ncbi:MAG: DNA-binding SARP family transcriptional activator [Myxococcota bacterium]|jgi:DNA-binding SARP family transcriptional activator